MVKTVEFWDATAEGYAKSSLGNEEVYKEKLETTQRYFDADSQVFEFRCGTGATALHQANFVQKIVATDFSSNMIEIAPSLRLTSVVLEAASRMEAQAPKKHKNTRNPAE